MNSNFSNVSIALFAKAPVEGEVKTRLIPLFGKKNATQLYRLMVFSMLSMLKQAGSYRLQLWCHPTAEHAFFTDLSQRFGVTLFQQQGDNLGERMHYAATESLRESELVILIGSDCLQVGIWHIHNVISRLLSGDDVVIIPAADGGYVLLGARRVDSQVFSGINWGCHTVMSDTRRRLEHLDWRYSELPEQRDVDIPEDLLHLIEHTNQYHLDEALADFVGKIRNLAFSKQI